MIQKQTIPQKHQNQQIQQENKPIKISYMVNFNDKNQGSFGLCHCPGKQIKMGRDGKPHNRNIFDDIKCFKEQNNINVIICLLNDYELRTIGVNVKKYFQACQKNDIEFLQLPMIEMAGPDISLQEFDIFLEEKVLNNINQGKNIICHCRGGIGRAGLVASCIFLKLQICQKTDEAIQKVRSIRDKRCVESKKQKDYIKTYLQFINQNNQQMQQQLLNMQQNKKLSQNQQK